MDIRDAVDWKVKRKIWARIPSAKSAVTRACTAIDKHTNCEYTFATPAACRDARRRLLEAFDFCVKLHDRWSDLHIVDSNDSASKKAEQSIKPYEEKQFASLDKLDKYIAKNEKAQTSTPVAETPDQTGTVPKLATCKLLFPEKLLKSKTPCEFRLWIAAFQRFHDASGLKQQSVATQQGYLLQALDADLQDVVARQIMPGMPIFRSTRCLDLLEAKFKSLYPIFNRRVDFFQVRKDQGESAEEFWQRLSKLGDMADLEAMSREDLMAFRFIDACDNKRLREKIRGSEIRW